MSTIRKQSKVICTYEKNNSTIFKLIFTIASYSYGLASCRKQVNIREKNCIEKMTQSWAVTKWIKYDHHALAQAKTGLILLMKQICVLVFAGTNY